MRRATISTHRFRVLAVMGAVVLAASLLVLAGAGKPAQAAFPGANGLIAFVSDRDTPIDPSTGEPYFYLEDPQDPTTKSYILNDDIYVTTEMEAESGFNPIRLTTNPAADVFPAVSPNGKEIAFLRGDLRDPDGNWNIYVMDAKDDDGNSEGDDLRPLTHSASISHSASIPLTPISWSPDSKKIAFPMLEDVGADSFAAIYVMDADGSETPTRLSNWEINNPHDDFQPVFSPDGTKVAFGSNRDGNNEIYVMKAEPESVTTNVPTRLTHDQAGADPVGDSQPEFSPDGTKIAFRSAPRRKNGEIWVMDAKDDDGDGIGDHLANLTNNPDKNHHWPAWSPDGTKIAFWSGTGNPLFYQSDFDSEIYVMDANDVSKPPTNITNTAEWGEIMPDWGPASKKKAHG